MEMPFCCEPARLEEGKARNYKISPFVTVFQTVTTTNSTTLSLCRERELNPHA